MNALPRTSWFMTIEEYLDFEMTSDVRHEYVAGELHALAGSSERHQIIAFNIASSLRDRARARDCRIVLNDVKLQVASAFIYYPDIMVLCDPTDDDPYVKERPTLVVEVLSPTTASTDRREKMVKYREISSLLCYLIVHQDERRIEQHWRDNAGDMWEYSLLLETLNSRIAVPGLDVELTFDEVYEGVSFEPES